MRFTWRSTDAVSTYHDWFSRIGAKDNRPGRSAPSLAKSWAGVVAVAGALNSHEDLGDFALSSAAIEAQTAFDTFPGGKRNHDPLLVGTSSSGATVVSIEAKADEPFGQTVRAAVAAAEKREAAGKSTNAAKRVEQLVVALIKHRALTDDRVLDLRYQLLTGMAGAVAAATAHEAVNAVFLVVAGVMSSCTPDTQRKNAKARYAPVYREGCHRLDRALGGHGLDVVHGDRCERHQTLENRELAFDPACTQAPHLVTVILMT